MNIKNIKFQHLLGSILLGAGLGLATFSFVIGNNLLQSRIKAYVVTSGSMEPVIKTGSIVFTRSSATYSQGDIISFYSDTSKRDVVTHRIAAITFEDGLNSPLYRTSGDANEEIDAWKVKNDQIIGRVTINIPYLGYIVNFSKTPKGFVALVIIPASIIIYEELKTLTKELKAYITKVFKKYRRNEVSSSKYKNYVFFFPVFVVFLIFISVSSAYFFDNELSIDNSIGVATTYGSPSPTPSPSPAPSPALSPSPSIEASPIENNSLQEPI